MNKESRIQAIKKVEEGTPLLKEEILYKDKLKPMDVFEIPLNCLIYNKYNGRILSRTKSVERGEHKIDVETPVGIKLIEKLLWDSKPDRNKKTLDSIKEHGQQKPGIITADGVIIDGNRRAMLLKKAGKDYFKAVILPDTLDENKLEIEKLETIHQMGEDKKLGYNPIEKYLKAKSLFSGLENSGENAEEAIKKIAKWMGEDESTVKDYLKIIKTMDDYLDYLGYEGIYTQLDGREDQFINLTKWLSNFYGEKSARGFDGYRDIDVDDLRDIAYDYIRAKFPTMPFRHIAHGNKDSHFFGDKEIWPDFRDFHFEKIDSVKTAEQPIDYNSENISHHLNDRDLRYYEATKNEKGKSFLEENINANVQSLRFRQEKDEPGKLIKNAKRALEAVDQKRKEFSEHDVQSDVQEVHKLTTKMLKDKSPERLLSEIVKLLEAVKVNEQSPNKEKLLTEISNINSISHDIKKKLGG